MPPTATILHISDLHLGASLEDSGGPGRHSGFSAAAAKHVWSTGGVLPPLQTHDYWVTTNLRQTVRDVALNDLQSRDGTFDCYVITGDISTDADTSSRFAFARQYLLGSAVPFRGLTLDIGLALPRASVLCVPGNHDKMFETHSDRYLSGFADLPGPPPYRRGVVARTGQQIVFYGIDSNFYGGRTIALGHVDEVNRDFLAGEMNALPARRTDGVVRVLLLHHHPVDLEKYRRWLSWKWYTELVGRRFSWLEEGRDLLDLCRGKIDIVMHGHEHFPIAFLDKASGCYIVSAGTTSKAGGREGVTNSFHAIAFYGSEFEVRQYDRVAGGGFDISRRWAGSLAYPRRPLAVR